MSRHTWMSCSFSILSVLLLAAPSLGQRHGTTSGGHPAAAPAPASASRGGHHSGPSAGAAMHSGHHHGSAFSAQHASAAALFHAGRHHHRHLFAVYPYAAFPGYYYPYYPAHFGYGAPSYFSADYAAGFPNVGGAIGDSTPLLSPPAQEDLAVVVVRLPAEAELWIEGVKMNKPGAVRRFVSPPLEPGVAYSYDVSATWMENGRKVEQTQTLTVRAGIQSGVTFLALPADGDETDASAKRR